MQGVRDVVQGSELGFRRVGLRRGDRTDWNGTERFGLNGRSTSSSLETSTYPDTSMRSVRPRQRQSLLCQGATPPPTTPTPSSRQLK